jgi:hypothetical protein
MGDSRFDPGCFGISGRHKDLAYPTNANRGFESKSKNSALSNLTGRASRAPRYVRRNFLNTPEKKKGPTLGTSGRGAYARNAQR